jgi:CRISPR-associated protein Cmr2
LPPYSFLLQLGFTLAKPYISRDDKAVYLCDNPIKKDRVFGLPLIEGSSWKGNMRWTARKRIEMDIGLTHDEKERKKKKLVSLFGNEKGDEENFRKGRLHFYPTFFDKIRLEVMNPQDRATRSGKDPILIETVPANSDGVFSILYLPFDLLGLDTCETVKEFYDDLKFVTNVIKEMMLTYGFSAKKSSGFGTVINKFSGSLVIKAFNRPFVFKKKKFEELEKHVEQLKQEVEAHAGR